ncbi:MAG: bile acid:sodium symporter family protein [Candidatus Limivivens sp.]|nr:bile acid:sodium symporter family protein [Candidatus Limivivens sp.]
MNGLKRLADLLSRYIGVVIIVFGILAFFVPQGFSWAVDKTTLLLGIAMFGMGLTIKAEDFRILLKRPRDMLIGCVAQFTIMPLAAFALAKLFRLSPDLAIGVILVGCCPGGTASNVITYIAGGDVALSVGMTILSTLLAPVLTPALVYVLGGSWVEVSFFAMMMSVVKVVLIPVVVGIILHEIFGKKVDQIRDFLPLVSVTAIVLLISGIIATNREKILACGLLVAAVVILHNVLGLALGYFAAKLLHLEPEKATAVAIEVGMQNSGLAISLATANFAANPLATLPGAIFSVWHNISGSVFAGLRKNAERKKG